MARAAIDPICQYAHNAWAEATGAAMSHPAQALAPTPAMLIAGRWGPCHSPRRSRDRIPARQRHSCQRRPDRARRHGGGQVRVAGVHTGRPASCARPADRGGGRAGGAVRTGDFHRNRRPDRLRPRRAGVCRTRSSGGDPCRAGRCVRRLPRANRLGWLR